MLAREEVAVLVAGAGAGAPHALLVDGAARVLSGADLLAAVRQVEERTRPRWVWWSARRDASSVVAAGVRPARAWDVAEAHRLLHGGMDASPALAWAAAKGLPADTVPTPPSGDLFDLVDVPDLPADEVLVDTAGHLRADHERWLEDPAHLTAWAAAALDAARAQLELAPTLSARLPATVASESAAAMLCLELERDGLPLDRRRTEELVTAAAGPRAPDPAAEARARRERDETVLQHVSGARVDLRNPADVKQMLASVGVDVPSTRKWVLEAYRGVHPVVGALLDWRRDERIATTYGYRWLDAHVGPDDRLRGAWTACDGAAGRMTAENGLHNLPAMLRPGVAAHPGHVFVRADLGQVEPRVLAVVAQDPAFAAATRADDLYSPVAERLGVDRPVAKVAVLAAMYGQRSGAAGEALRGLEAAYPVAMRLLDEAYELGRWGRPLRTYGGRLVPTGRFLAGRPVGSDPALDAARGRFARNAVIQGSAAELFKAWAATVRATTADLGASIVLCLHDELLLHVPSAAASEAARRVDTALGDAARRWSAGAPVRFVADTQVVARWSDAKD